MATKADTAQELSAEEQKLVDWRIDQFTRMGVGREDATNLAHRPEVSYHEFRRLVRAGCPVELAVRIVA